MKPLLLVGCGGHARSVIDIIESTGVWQIHGLVGLPEQVGGEVLGKPVIGSDADLPSLKEVCSTAVLAIGQLPTPELRKTLASQLQQLGFQFPVIKSPHAVVSPHARLGHGTVVCHGAISTLGLWLVLIASERPLLIEHDVRIGDYAM